MSYSFESRVRFSEIGEDGCLTLPGVLDYFQDCCTFESEQTGVGMEVLKEQKRAWVLSAWQVITKRYPKLGENIKVTTIPYGFRGFIGMRNFILETMDGEKLAWANSYWSFINTETGLPEKLTPIWRIHWPVAALPLSALSKIRFISVLIEGPLPSEAVKLTHLSWCQTMLF